MDVFLKAFFINYYVRITGSSKGVRDLFIILMGSMCALDILFAFKPRARDYLIGGVSRYSDGKMYRSARSGPPLLGTTTTYINLNGQLN